MAKPKSKTMCSVFECHSYCDKINKIALHQFPKDAGLKKQWLHATRIPLPITKNYFVCSSHFENTDYKSEINKHYLKRTAVPSKNLPKLKFSKPPAKPRSLRLLNDQNVVNVLQITAADETAIVKKDDVEEPKVKEFVDAGIQTTIILDCIIDRDIARNSQVTVDDLITTSSQLNIMTSLNDAHTIQLIENSIKKIDLEPEMYSNIFQSQFSIKLKILLVLIKLNQNLDFSVLSVLFGVSIPTCIKYFKQMLPVIRAGLKSLIYWPSKEEILMNIPTCFKKFSDVRAVLDCTEIEISQTNCLKCKVTTYSHYKGRNTVKFLVAVSPAGLITYISQGYTGKASDKHIFNEENLIELLGSNDAVMVDKGFAIENDLKLKGIKLFRPTFKNSKRQFDKDETIYNTPIAAARVHVERAIQRIKIYKILQNRIDHCLFPAIDDVFNIICSLVNLSNPILNDNKF